jgi:hypothetical protein
MEGAKPGHGYEMVNVRPGYVIVEHEVFSKQMRSYFSPEAVPPVEEYREGPKIWKFSGMAQSFQFDLRDRTTGGVTKFDDLLGLVPYSGCRDDSDIHRLGDLAQAEKIWIYVAITHGPVETARQKAWLEKLRILNRYFGERLETPNKKILILPDYFGLYKEFSHGQILADLGLTAMEA